MVQVIPRNRKQCVNINGNSSKFSDILCGVPQGSTLGLLLFLIYIDDIYTFAPKVSFHLFVDDTFLQIGLKQTNLH